jgi:hypothetical protein
MPLGHGVDDTMITCALRFDGDAYASRLGDDELLTRLADRVVETLRTSPDQNENLAAFYALQRWLYKWGGETLPENSRDRQAFRLLFLHVYRVEVEESLRFEKYHEKWLSLGADLIEDHAAAIRESLLPKRKGPSTSA